MWQIFNPPCDTQTTVIFLLILLYYREISGSHDFCKLIIDYFHKTFSFLLPGSKFLPHIVLHSSPLTHRWIYQKYILTYFLVVFSSFDIKTPIKYLGQKEKASCTCLGTVRLKKWVWNHSPFLTSLKLHCLKWPTFGILFLLILINVSLGKWARQETRFN